jgi:hypothetical protein
MATVATRLFWTVGSHRRELNDVFDAIHLNTAYRAFQEPYGRKSIIISNYSRCNTITQLWNTVLRCALSPFVSLYVTIIITNGQLIECAGGLTTILNSGEHEATVSPGQGFKCGNTVIATVGGADVRS